MKGHFGFMNGIYWLNNVYFPMVKTFVLCYSLYQTQAFVKVVDKLSIRCFSVKGEIICSGRCFEVGQKINYITYLLQKVFYVVFGQGYSHAYCMGKILQLGILRIFTKVFQVKTTAKSGVFE